MNKIPFFMEKDSRNPVSISKIKLIKRDYMV